ncbi:MAG: hypothetical protein GX456_08100 [Verrucomicrobia bacterium]|nr:hypothetical protein [Verrucomicrobiota bacterium]
MTDRKTWFNHANPVPEHSPVGCGEESPRSCTRWKPQRRSGARPSRPHQPDDRSYNPFQSHKPDTRMFTGTPNPCQFPTYLASTETSVSETP